MYRVAVNIHDQTNLYHASHALAGLYSLAAQREAEVRLVSAGYAPPHAAVLQLEVARDDIPGIATRRVAIDLLDRSDIVDAEVLAACHVYFKRSFFPPDLAKLAAGYGGLAVAEKVRPWGLNFPCRPVVSLSRLSSLTARGFLSRGLRALVRGVRDTRQCVMEVKQFACLPAASQFVADEHAQLEPTVVFQTRLWEQHETEPDDAGEVNRLRVQLVRALRLGLGKSFVGGLIATPLARREFPDEVVLPQQSRMVNYAARSRRAMIGVYTRGLHHSTAFKLAEYLAGGKVIVAAGLRNGTQAPLEPGLHWVGFQSADECVEQCRRLLHDPERCTPMRRAAAEYYRCHVEPAAHLRWTLAAAFRPNLHCVLPRERATELEVA